MLTFLLLTLWCHGPLSPFLPAAYEPILLFYGQLHPTLLVALAGAFASAAAECLNYYLYRAMLGRAGMGRVMSSRAGRAVTTMFAKRPFFAVWMCAWSPLPDWAARVLASHTRYSIRRYLAAVLAGRIPKFWFLAAVGMHWAPSAPTIATIVVISVAVTLAATFLGRSNRPAVAVGRAAALVIVGLVVFSAGPLFAQSSLGRGRVSGPSFDRFGSPLEGKVALGYRWSRLTGAGPAEDLAVRLFPVGLAYGIAIVGVEAGAMQALAVGPVALFVKGGASGIAGIGLGDAAVLLGVQGGAGALVRLERRAAVRVDVTRHSFYSGGEHYGVWSFGLSLAVLPPAAGTGPR